MPYNDMLVIEQESGDDNSNLDYFTYITIGFVYVFFLSLLVDRLLNYDRVEQICDTKNMQYGTDQYNTRVNVCKKTTNDYDTKKFMYMVVLGVLSVLGGGYLVQSDPRYTTGGCGVALGGVISIIYYTTCNWSNINKDVRVIVLGLTFALLFYGSTRLYQ